MAGTGRGRSIILASKVYQVQNLYRISATFGVFGNRFTKFIIRFIRKIIIDFDFE